VRASAAGDALLFEVLRVDALDVARLQQLSNAVSDWRPLIRMSESTAVAAMLWNAVGAATLAPRIERAELDRLRELSEATPARAATAIALARRVGRVLHRANVAAVAIKGGALLLRYPEYRAFRYVSDLDLIVRSRDWDLFDDALTSAGFRRENVDPELVHDGHCEAVYRDLCGLMVEAHGAPPGGTQADADAIFGRSELVGAGIRVPCLEDMLGIACRHALEHHRTDPRHIPRMIADVHVLLAHGADAERARVWHDYPGSKPVATALKLMRGRRIPKPAPVTSLIRLYAQQTRRFGWRFFLPTPAYVARKYGVSPRSPRLPFLYVLRLFEGVARLLRPGR
jgi:hypothetical protein